MGGVCRGLRSDFDLWALEIVVIYPARRHSMQEGGTDVPH